ncbi:MAG: PEP-CTERM sorting domain-containing protein [Gemmatimonadota bacterium]|nr:PEP-CTERM sorting domain-containing protein [Gemmatimonadota bacterium]
MRAGTLAVALCLLPAGAAAQFGTSTSRAYIYDATNNNNPYPCNQTDGPAASTTKTCGPLAVTNGFGTSTSSSNNAARTASAYGAFTADPIATAPGDREARGISYQYSALTVTGTPSSADQLIFHFIFPTPPVAGGPSTGADAVGNGYWELYLSNSSGTYSASAHQFNGIGVATTGIAMANPSGTGFDFRLPFTPGGTFGYYFETSASGSDNGSPATTTTFTGSLSVKLEGVDAANSNGVFSHAIFDSNTGLGSIDLTAQSTVPEPSSMSLMAIGLVGIATTVRKRLKKPPIP